MIPELQKLNDTSKDIAQSILQIKEQNADMQSKAKLDAQTEIQQLNLATDQQLAAIKYKLQEELEQQTKTSLAEVEQEKIELKATFDANVDTAVSRLIEEVMHIGNC